MDRASGYRLVRIAGLLLSVLLVPAPSGAVVVSEIHYHPPAGDEALEFIEIASDSSTPEDLSGYAFVDGIRYVFPPGTILSGGDVLVVCSDADAVRSRYGIDNVLGDYEGRLDGGGERVTLVNHTGIVVQNINYRDRGKWPVGPDGTGHSLVLRSVYLDTKEPESWTRSPELGGSPGRRNFPDPTEPRFDETVIIDTGAEWRYRGGAGPFSDPPSLWKELDYDDGTWAVGSAGFGFADDDDMTILDDMRGNYSTLAARHRFELPAELLEAEGEFFLGVDYDDGFCAYLNGAEIARSNCPDEPNWDDNATRSREAGEEQLFGIDRTRLREGENVLALLGLNRSLNSNDFSLIPRLVHRRFLEEEEPEDFGGFFNELYRGSEPESGWVEVFNSSAVPRDLSGLRVTDDPDRDDAFVFPQGTTIVSGGFLVLREADTSLELSTPLVQLFLLDPGGLVLAASAFDRDPSPELEVGDFSEARFPDGGASGWVTTAPTPGAANEVPRVTALVINEIFYHPPEDRRGEFLELYHRGTEELDLSGFRFTKGIDYAFPPGTRLGPGDYLVIAEDPEVLREHYGYERALGPYEGRLADAGENVRLVDGFGNLVDEVRYWDGGRWSHWADGRGSSLELIDPDQDNHFASAWEASDETEKSAWEEFSYEVPRYTTARESELHLYLVEPGECRIDDVSIRQEGDEHNFIPNPGFEEDTRPWRIEGTHVRSHRTTSDQHSGTACLEVVASGKGDHFCNRIETDTVPALRRESYTVSLWARWLRGTSRIVLHGEYTSGPWTGGPGPATNLSGNPLGYALRLTVPWNLGTPGAENSTRRRLRNETGGTNLGPVIADVGHHPAAPLPSFPVAIQARVHDANGVEEVRVFFRDGDAAGEFASAELLDDGAHDDGPPGDGVYGGPLPGFPVHTRVVFYIEARDRAGAVERYPVDAPGRTCLYMTANASKLALDFCRIVLDEERLQELRGRPLHSNDLVDGAFFFDDERAFYNVGVRYRGSSWGRPSRMNFRVRLGKDQRLHRGFKDVNLSQSSPTEGAAYFLVGRNGTLEKPAPAADYQYVRAAFNTQSLGIVGMIQTVDRDYIEKWYGEEAAEDVVVLKANGREAVNDACQRTAWDAASFIYREENSENYRGYWVHSVHQTRDDWESFIALHRVMDRRANPDPEKFDREVDTVLDVEGFLRELAPRILMAEGDALFLNSGHNGYMVRDPRDGLWELIAFDMDGAFRSSNVNLFSSGDPHVQRLLSRPAPRRTYYRVLAGYIDGYWSAEKAGPFIDALAATGVSTASVKGHLNTTRNRVASQIRRFVQAEFRILTNDGNDFTTDTPIVELEGEAPVGISRLLVQRSGGEPRPLEPEWTDPTTWLGTFEVPDEENRLEIIGLDETGEVHGIVGITVTNSSAGFRFIRGDSSGDLAVNLGDAIITLLHLFGGRPATCPDAADVDDNGGVEATDVILLLEYLFESGAPPAPPFPEPGRDPSEDALGCARSPAG